MNISRRSTASFRLLMGWWNTPTPVARWTNFIGSWIGSTPALPGAWRRGWKKRSRFLGYLIHHDLIGLPVAAHIELHWLIDGLVFLFYVPVVGENIQREAAVLRVRFFQRKRNVAHAFGPLLLAQVPLTECA